MIIITMRDFSSRRMDYDFDYSKPKRRGRGDKEMFSAVCDDCGKDCEVPFKPSGNKPIYCSRCFDKHGGDDNRNDRRDSRGRDNRRRDSRGSREMFDVVCDNCGKPDRVPFKPSSDKPIYCSDCFESKGGNNKGASNALLEEINEKLDRILEKLEA